MNICCPTRQVVECMTCKRFRIVEPKKNRDERRMTIIDASVIQRPNRVCPLWKPFNG